MIVKGYRLTFDTCGPSIRTGGLPIPGAKRRSTTSNSNWRTDMATKKAEALKKVPVRKAKTGVTWKNKTIDEFKVSEGHHWIAQLSKNSNGDYFRSIRQ